MQTVSDDVEREQRQSDHHSGKDEQMGSGEPEFARVIILPTKEWVPECLNPESSFLLPREIAL